MEKTCEISVRAVELPKKELIALCKACNAVLAREPWSGYHDYNRRKAAVEKRFSNCPKCKAQFQVLREKPKWEKEKNGDLVARCKNGDFCIWKYGNAFKWRYRTYGTLYATQMGFATTKEYAKSACERHKEWKL